MPTLIFGLLGAPLAAGLLLLVARGRARTAVVSTAAAVMIALALLSVARFGGDDLYFGLPSARLAGPVLLAAEAAITLFLVAVSVMHRRVLAPILALIQLAAMLTMELGGAHVELDPGRAFRVDRLAMVLLVIAAVIGPLICVQALGYMRDYHRHYPRIKGSQPVFFSLLFVFLSAMVGLVVSNHLPLLFFFWEATTLCSFLLIGYTRTPDTIGYAFDALNMNLVGGLGFALAMVWLSRTSGGLDLARLAASPAGAAILPAVALLALSGLTKSAQMPFSSWLLGAMYAPTPTSALLHSSTMVKAGVFLLLRLSPAMAGTVVGRSVTLIGLGTFLFASLVAMTEKNVKRVLAFSTIGNLGLVVGCAGVGMPEALWVGVMIVIFHAVAKSLLFLVAGTLENRLYSKDLETFDHLIARLPRVSALALTGIAGMFLAPFGVVLAKWSALRAFLAVPGWLGAVSLLLLAFGSSCTIFYWSKLLLKILSLRKIDDDELAVEARVSAAEWLSEATHAVLVVALAAGVGILSSRVVSPIALAAFSAPQRELFHLGPGLVAVLVLAVLCLPALALWQLRRGRFDLADIYAGGRDADARHEVAAALGEKRQVEQRNYYLEGVIDGPRIFRFATVASALLLAALFILTAMVLA
jgi:ech hydrogenase subunit A